MKEKVLFGVILLISFLSCNTEKRYKKVIPVPIKHHVMDITSYTGNAVAFFHEGHDYFYSVYIIPIEEKDSNIFKKKDFDVFKSIIGQCSIYFTIGYDLYKLQASDSKKKLNQKVCNVYTDRNTEYYIKVWISYKDYVESKEKRKKVLTSDSCEIRDAHRRTKGKLLEFNILMDSK